MLAPPPTWRAPSRRSALPGHLHALAASCPLACPSNSALGSPSVWRKHSLRWRKHFGPPNALRRRRPRASRNPPERLGPACGRCPCLGQVNGGLKIVLRSRGVSAALCPAAAAGGASAARALLFDSAGSAPPCNILSTFCTDSQLDLQLHYKDTTWRSVQRTVHQGQASILQSSLCRQVGRGHLPSPADHLGPAGALATAWPRTTDTYIFYDCISSEAQHSRLHHP